MFDALIVCPNPCAIHIQDSYAARVSSTRMYDSVSRDVLARWTYPIVPDCNMLGDTSIQCFRPHVYKEKQLVKLARHAEASF